MPAGIFATEIVCLVTFRVCAFCRLAAIAKTHVAATITEPPSAANGRIARPSVTAQGVAKTA